MGNIPLVLGTTAQIPASKILFNSMQWVLWTILATCSK